MSLTSDDLKYLDAKFTEISDKVTAVEVIQARHDERIKNIATKESAKTGTIVSIISSLVVWALIKIAEYGLK